MTNRDWERFGEDIRKTVQDAIDSQDFDKLNQTITNTINNAADALARNIGNAGKAQPVQKKKEKADLYRKTGSAKAVGLLLSITGITLGSVFIILFFIFLFSAFFSTGFTMPFRIVSSVFFILAGGCCVMGGCGSRLLGQVKRFREYVSVLAGREYCNIKELADRLHKSEKYVVKDLKKMISKGWFTQGYLDGQETCLMTSREMYEQYLSLQRERERIAQDEEKRKLEESERKVQMNPLSPEVQKIIDEGDEYICKIHACNDAIPGVEISAKISRMEMLVDKIFDRVEQNPDSVDDIRKLMEYYLPTTIKLLKAYEELDAQPGDGENIRASKAEIEATLDTLNIAFEKLLDSLFQETAWDVSSDISVLNTMLAQEGLTEDGMRK